MKRCKLFAIFLLVMVLVPIILLTMLVDIIVGCDSRAMAIAIGIDEAGNGAMGGDPSMTVSTRVGNALKKGKRWARPAAAVIDFFFGEGHCLNNSSI